MIDLHLGQKPKLGGRYTDISLTYISYYVGTLYIHVSFSFFFVVVSCSDFIFQNPKRPKIFLLFLFVYLLCTSSTGLLYLLASVWYSKIQKDFALFVCSFLCSFQIENPKIFVVLLWFCIVVAEFNSLP